MPTLREDLVLETDRLRLRFPVEADLVPIFEATRDAEFMAGQTWTAPTSFEAMGPFFEGVLRRWREGHVHQLSVELRADGRFVGVAALIVSPEAEPLPPSLHVGFFTIPNEQERGYATEALGAVLGYIFAEFPTDAVYAQHAEFNAASARVLEKAGFERVLCTPGGFVKGDVTSDDWLLRLDRATWESRRP